MPKELRPSHPCRESSLADATIVGCRLQNCNDRPWTSSYPVALDSADFAPGFAAPLGVRNAQSGQDLTPRAQRSIRMLSEELPEKLTLQVTHHQALFPRPLLSVRPCCNRT